MHQHLLFTTAEDPEEGADVSPEMDRSIPGLHEAPKAKSKGQEGTSATMEAVIQRLREAFEQVEANQGAPGPDRQTIEHVRARLDELIASLSPALASGQYQPGDVRRVYIPKAGGGQRGLGIPNVIDRMVQEAVRQTIEPLFEPGFHPSSHGFRRNRSCHTAITQAREFVEEGHEWVVDLDLERFFDSVCHQRLMARLASKIGDRRLLVLIGRMLKARVVLPDGVLVSTQEGLPQGGPLSPLLSNIVLDELDWELDRRGHRFVRYADDCNVYVSSERAGQRVMASVRSFIERRLRLKVNEHKSAVARPRERHFLGFRLSDETPDASWCVLLSKRSQERLAEKIRGLTPRNWGDRLQGCITQINAYLRGWIGYFGICTGSQSYALLDNYDAHIRRRLRALMLKQWKRKRTRARGLIRLGIRPNTAWRAVYEGRKSCWALSLAPAVSSALRNAYFTERGLLSLLELWRQRQPYVAPEQPASSQG